MATPECDHGTYHASQNTNLNGCGGARLVCWRKEKRDRQALEWECCLGPLSLLGGGLGGGCCWGWGRVVARVEGVVAPLRGSASPSVRAILFLRGPHTQVERVSPADAAMSLRSDTRPQHHTHAAQEAGGIFCICTGRDRGSARTVLKGIDIEKHPGVCPPRRLAPRPTPAKRSGAGSSRSSLKVVSIPHRHARHAKARAHDGAIHCNRHAC